uniref:Putative ovule protein n=1 Tax=Solanum chacoense TaxID=4108 RepID=A0A0V0H295_SOLCH
MVEVLGDYSEDFGVCIAPLVKLDGFKTVYRRNTNQDAIRKIPKREMLRFSHQVPSCLLKRETMNLPEGCWELDPAATPDDLLQGASDVQEERPIQTERSSRVDLDETSQAETRILAEQDLRQLEYSAVPDMFDEATPVLQIQENSNEQQALFRPSTELPQSASQIHTCEEPSKLDNHSATTPGEHPQSVMNE